MRYELRLQDKDKKTLWGTYCGRYDTLELAIKDSELQGFHQEEYLIFDHESRLVVTRYSINWND